MKPEKEEFSRKDILESLAIRGIAIEIQKLSFPRIKNLNELLEPLGYHVIKKTGS